MRRPRPLFAAMAAALLLLACTCLGCGLSLLSYRSSPARVTETAQVESATTRFSEVFNTHTPAPTIAPEPSATATLTPTATSTETPTLTPTETETPTETPTLEPKAATALARTETSSARQTATAGALATATEARQSTLSARTLTDAPLPTQVPTALPAIVPTQPPAAAYRIGATCADGTRSTATGSGACSRHGGVQCWQMSDGSCVPK